MNIEFANPLREHDMSTRRCQRLLDQMALLPGMIDAKDNFVEHPELVAQRIAATVAAIGDREQ